MPADAAKPSLRAHHLAVKVRDLVRAEAFWSGALGLPVMRRQEDESGAPRSIWLSLGEGVFLAVERAETDEPLRADGSPGWHCVALGIDASERESWRARLTQHGHAIVRETAYTLYVRDPEGAIVALSHYPHALAERVSGMPEGEAAPEPSAATSTADAIEAGPDTALESRTSAGVTSRLAALVTLSIVLLAFLASALPARAQRPPPDVLVIGSSSVFGPLGVVLEEHLEALGLRVRRHSHRSTGFARPDFFDWQAEIASLRDVDATRGVVVVMGGNDTHALRLTREESPDRGDASWVQWRDEARWRAIYASRVHTFVDALCEAGAPRVLVLLPTDGDREGWSERIHRVQEAQLEGVRGTRCGAVLDPRSDRPVRDGDTLDGVHLSTRGAREAVARIGPALVAALAAR